MGVKEFSFRYEQLKINCRVLLLGFPVAMVTDYVTTMTPCCSAIVGVSYGTITLLIRNTAL